MTGEKVIRIRDVARCVGLSIKTVRRLCRNGDFPQSIRLGGLNARAVGWRVSEVESWIESRPAATGK